MLNETVCRGIVFIGLTLAAVPAGAQEPATSIDQLRVLIGHGDTVRVTDAGGHETKGSVVGLSASSLTLRVGDAERILQEPEIRAIRHRRDDTLRDGARLGFIIGAVLGFVGGLAIANEVDFAAYVPLAAGVYGGIGAGIGAGVDAMITSDRTIYDINWPKKKALSVKLASW
jgi:hypothetical protein